MEKKQKKYLCYIALGTVLLMLLAAYEDKQSIPLQGDGTLLRGEPGEGDYETTLNITVPELEESQPYSLLIEEQEYSTAEREALFERARQEIDKIFCAPGEKLGHITKRVNLSEALQGGLVSVKWSFEKGTLIQPDGTIDENAIEADGMLEIVRAEMSYKEYECVYEFPVYIYPQELVGMDKVLSNISVEVARQNQEASQQATLQLPQTVDEYEIEWTAKPAHTPLVVLILGMATALAVVLGAKRGEQQQQERRNRQLQLEYPKMVAKMSLYMGSGMTTKTAWEKQVETYNRQLQQGHQKESELYEQMQTTCRQMQEGVGERSAYEQFSERIGLSNYRRFALMLVQNLQKGTAGLAKELEAEAERAFEERKNMARRLGEEAGTKLLLPMMLMLFVIIVILVVPAFLTMTI